MSILVTRKVSWVALEDKTEVLSQQKKLSEAKPCAVSYRVKFDLNS